MTERIFIYGTLHPDRAPREISRAARTLKSVGKGEVRGYMHDLGEYPGLVLDTKAPVVVGEVFELSDAGVLKDLDEYEEFIPENPRESLFLRKRTRARLADGKSILCWIYVLNHRRSRVEARRISGIRRSRTVRKFKELQDAMYVRMTPAERVEHEARIAMMKLNYLQVPRD